jgi:hypothetical protein
MTGRRRRIAAIQNRGGISSVRVVTFGDIALADVRVEKCWRSRGYDPADIAELAQRTAGVGLLEHGPIELIRTML